VSEVQGKDKAFLRTEFLARRRGLTAEQVKIWSAAATARLLALPEAQGAETWLVYLASKDNELDTLPLVESLLGGGKTILVPVIDKGGLLLWSRLGSLSEVAPAQFGILEPRPECRRIALPPGDALVIVPGIAFTRDGARIGYGGGYYDRFLGGFAGTKIALAFELQLADAIPTAPHDVFLDVVVTEAAVYRCRP
jgi:5-formyltetrahydrofolate cyclo-ligase